MTETEGPSSPTSGGEDAAASFIGKYVLVGLTFQDEDRNLIRKEQIHGVITAIGADGIELLLHGRYEGNVWKMPPDLNALHPANPGRYRLHATGETVRNPDFVSNWTITEPRQAPPS